jgi:hypothetical protein
MQNVLHELLDLKLGELKLETYIPGCAVYIRWIWSREYVKL